MPIRALIRDGGNGQWLAYRNPVAVLAAAGPLDVPRVLDDAEQRARRDHLHAVGFVTYEAAPGLDPKQSAHPPGRLPPAWFALFSAPRPASPPLASWPPPLHWQPHLAKPDYRSAIEDIRTRIAAGEIYQVNFSYRLRSRLVVPDESAAARLFGFMIGRQPGGYGAFIETGEWAICSASPELFFTRRGRRLCCRPMKGTAPRGETAAEDAERARWLWTSLKNRAENLMITDMVRSDLGRLAATGSVQVDDLFCIEAHPTVWQMTSTVSADSGAGIAETFRALFPAASITGAPKRRTMTLIRGLEREPREIYTGAVGMIRPDGDAQFNVAIRTAFLDKRHRRLEYGVGGGILWDSDADEEHDETLTKAGILKPPRPDAGFSLLETLRWEPTQGFWLLDAHLARLQAAARHFFGASLDDAALRHRLGAATARCGVGPQRVRLLVNAAHDIDATATPLEASPPSRRVTLAATPAPLIDNPFVLHKTTRRGVYDAARQDALARVPEADDVLLVNERGEVTESTVANLVVDVGGALVTPPADAGLLPGVYRRTLLASGRVAERTLYPDDVRNARAVYLANSLRGLWRVTLVA